MGHRQTAGREGHDLGPQDPDMSTSLRPCTLTQNDNDQGTRPLTNSYVLMCLNKRCFVDIFANH